MFGLEQNPCPLTLNFTELNSEHSITYHCLRGLFQPSSRMLCQTFAQKHSVLDPLLFSLYTNPISQIFTKASISYHLYAEDKQIYISFSPNQSCDSLSLLFSTLDKVYAWLTSNSFQSCHQITLFLLL